MGLRATLAAAADAAFDAFDDVPVVCTLRIEDTVHNPATAGSSKGIDDHEVKKVALVRFKVSEIGAPLFGQRGALLSNRSLVEASDVKAIFRTKELPANINPRHKDRLIPLAGEYFGHSFRIEAVAHDPADVVWILQLRAR